MAPPVVFAIGDLHSDAGCARAWVHKTNLVANLQSVPEQWEWKGGEQDRIVFMGDYIDKGARAKQTLLFVKQLNQRFGDEKIVAIMGNHELNLLIDRQRPQGQRYLDYVYAVAHPSAYLDWLPPTERTSSFFGSAVLSQ